MSIDVISCIIKSLFIFSKCAEVPTFSCNSKLASKKSRLET